MWYVAGCTWWQQHRVSQQFYEHFHDNQSRKDTISTHGTQVTYSNKFRLSVNHFKSEYSCNILYSDFILYFYKFWESQIIIKIMITLLHLVSIWVCTLRKVMFCSFSRCLESPSFYAEFADVNNRMHTSVTNVVFHTGVCKISSNVR